MSSILPSLFISKLHDQQKTPLNHNDSLTQLLKRDTQESADQGCEEKVPSEDGPLASTFLAGSHLSRLPALLLYSSGSSHDAEEQASLKAEVFVTGQPWSCDSYTE